MALADILPADLTEDDFEDAGADAVVVHTWTREDYERMAELGFFQDHGETISPVARLEVSVAVDDLLPS